MSSTIWCHLERQVSNNPCVSHVTRRREDEERQVHHYGSTEDWSQYLCGVGRHSGGQAAEHPVLGWRTHDPCAIDLGEPRHPSNIVVYSGVL